jgi:UDP-N-acetylglucosamine acyltransferase
VSFTGINSIGLNRRGFTPEQIHTIQEVYRLLYQNSMNTTQALNHIEATIPASAERDAIVAFVRNSTRGVIKA